MNRIRLIPIIMALLVGVVTASWGQEPIPTRVPLSQSCTDAGVDSENLLKNGDFSSGNRVPDYSPEGGWGAGIPSGVIRQEVISEELVNYYVELTAGSSIFQIPTTENNYNYFDIKMCVVVPAGGQLQIYAGGSPIALIPQSGESGFNGQFEKTKIPMDLGSAQSAESNVIEIRYIGDEGTAAFVDNIQLVINITESNPDEGTPTPTPEPETPTPTPGGPTITPTPTYLPGFPTPPPTPSITDGSVQAIVNPPMLMVGPDDFASGSSSKVINIDMQVVGSDGEIMNILAKDPDATVRLDIETRGDAANVGVIQQLTSSGTNWKTINRQSIKLADLGSFQFCPTKPYNGTVKIIVDIDYKSYVRGTEDRRKIRGVIPIVLRVNDLASLTDATGTFNPVQNFGLNRKPGDRGFRPDTRTNLFFRERFEQ